MLARGARAARRSIFGLFPGLLCESPASGGPRNRTWRCGFGDHRVTDTPVPRGNRDCRGSPSPPTAASRLPAPSPGPGTQDRQGRLKAPPRGPKRALRQLSSGVYALKRGSAHAENRRSPGVLLHHAQPHPQSSELLPIHHREARRRPRRGARRGARDPRAGTARLRGGLPADRSHHQRAARIDHRDRDLQRLRRAHPLERRTAPSRRGRAAGGRIPAENAQRAGQHAARLREQRKQLHGDRRRHGLHDRPKSVVRQRLLADGLRGERILQRPGRLHPDQLDGHLAAHGRQGR